MLKWIPQSNGIGLNVMIEISIKVDNITKLDLKLVIRLVAPAEYFNTPKV